MASVYTFITKKRRGKLLKKGDEITGHVGADGQLIIFHHTGWYHDDLQCYDLKEQTKKGE